jgi:hypothetical protein
MRRAQRAKAAGLLALAVLLGGCSSDGSGVKLAPVTGRLVWKKQAVRAAEVFLIPDKDKGNQGEQGNALLAAEDGHFTVQTSHPKGPRNGVAPGAYKVIVSMGRTPDKELIKYRMAQSTPLHLDVPEGGLEDIVIDLDKGKIETP